MRGSVGATPGPWTVREEQYGKGYAPGAVKCEVWAGGTYIATAGPLGAASLDLARANAALIASAPSLLAENARLREALARICRMADPHNTDDDAALAEARRMLADAEIDSAYTESRIPS